jgi:hypothetical protein
LENIERTQGREKKIILIMSEDVADWGEPSAIIQERCDKIAAERVARAKSEGYQERDILVIQTFEPDGLDG